MGFLGFIGVNIALLLGRKDQRALGCGFPPFGLETRRVGMILEDPLLGHMTWRAWDGIGSPGICFIPLRGSPVLGVSTTEISSKRGKGRDKGIKNSVLVPGCVSRFS